MFDTKVYIKRREVLKKLIPSGVILFPGNSESPMNYPANPFHFRQDSNFLYYFGIDQPDLFALIDVDEDREILFGEDVTMDDIIWMGDKPKISDRAQQAGVKESRSADKIRDILATALEKDRIIHYAPVYRKETAYRLSKLLDRDIGDIERNPSEALIRAIVSQRSIKDEQEIAEIEKAVDIAWEMHTTSMRMARPGVYEREITGTIEGISLKYGSPVSFPVIQSMDGQILHNHYHGNKLVEGRMMVTDAGSETIMHYASDITRTVPVGGRFNQRQKEIYSIVLRMIEEATAKAAPGVTNRELHLHATRVLVEEMKNLGLMKGDVEEAVKQGAHALFFPHGLGHMMGLDVHDMEGLGEDYVGYDDEVRRSDQFGLAFLRLGRKLEPGFVITIEPGCYFIPALIDLWRSEGRFREFIAYEKLDAYRDFGGIRVEDDVLITAEGHRILGRPIPKTIEEVEKTALSS